MSEAEFDRHAAHYRELHQRNIALSGETPEYFAAYKMHDFAELVRGAGLPKDGRFVDFGSGIGASVTPFRAYFPDAHLTCADVSTESLAISRAEHGRSADYLLMSEDRLPAADASFDGGFACCVFHHIGADKHLSTLAELRRVIKPGGLLMIYEHNPFNPLTVHLVDTCPLDANAVLIRGPNMVDKCLQTGWREVRLDYRVFFPAFLRRLRFLENHLRWLPLGAQYFVCVRA
jgi:SAM-dependent methyltransferase